MNPIRVGAATLNQTPLDWDGNARRIRAAITRGRELGVTLLCLPELCIPGYGCEDAFLSPDVVRRGIDLLFDLAAETREMVVSLGLPVMHHGALYDCAALLADGAVQGLVAKRHLAGDGIHYEPRWFKPWPEREVAEVVLRGRRTWPLGDLVFDCGGVRVGFEVCEDAWVAHRPGASLAARGVDVVLNPSASHFAFAKRDVRTRFVLEGSRAFSCGYAYANLVGNEAGRAVYDGGAMVAAGGRMLSAGPRFSFHEADVVSADVDVDAMRLGKARLYSFRTAPTDVRGSVVAVPFAWPDLEPGRDPLPASAGWEHGSHLKEEEFTRAVALALHDYLRKSRARGAVVSLSGGCDSAAVACLVATMVDLGLAELGRDAFVARFAHVPGLADRSGRDDLVRVLLTCVYQATANSGTVTRDAARTVAEALPATWCEVDVEPMVRGYTELAARSLGRDLDWDRDDLALQNVQARARAPLAWLLANVKGALLLTTSNRSEAAVGYATMDGDTAGGLAPIAGIDKAWLRTWLRWMETAGPEGLAPLPALSAVTVQPPTAELRPPALQQRDEDDLMPYPALDLIERAAIRDKRSPIEVYRAVRPHYPGVPAVTVGAWVERFFRLWCRNQWKRERYAPSFHLDDENLDPKTWCRFPILSGGYERELAELAEVVARDRRMT